MKDKMIEDWDLEELFKSQRELKDLKINNPNEYNKKFEYVMRR